MYFSTRQDFIGTRTRYVVYIYIYDIRAGDPRTFKNFNPSYFIFTLLNIIDFSSIKHELNMLACLQFLPIKKDRVQYFTTITKER